ncbi:MAG: sugar ABC transporter permease [Thermoanaerobaculia bacterium]
MAAEAPRKALPSEVRAAWLFIGPGLAIIFLFFLLPIAAALLLSLTDFDLYAVADWRNLRLVGFDNYSHLLRDSLFWKSMRNTVYFVLVGGPLTVVVSLGAALMIQSRLTRFQGIFRTAFFAPAVTTLVAVAAVWRYLYHPNFGLLNHFLSWFGVAPIDWLGDTRWAMPSIILLSIWKNFGANMIILAAGLQSIPESLYEAARLEGAGWWRQLRHVTLPMLAPTFLFVAVMTCIGYFQLFAEPFVLTRQGEPLNSTLSVALLMYKQGFRFWHMGYAAAIAFVLFVVILGATTLQVRLARRGEA